MTQILIVDDEAEIRTLIRNTLERAGLQIIEAESGRQAIERMQEHPIDLMILDLMMDNGNGFEVLQYLRKPAQKRWLSRLAPEEKYRTKLTHSAWGRTIMSRSHLVRMELLARVQAQLRRHTSPIFASVRDDPIEQADSRCR